MPSALGSAAVSIGGSLLTKKLAGSPKTPSGSASGGGRNLVPFTGGGVKLRFDDLGRPVLSSAGGERADALTNLKGSFLDQAAGIRGTFAPGIDRAFGEGIGGIQGLLDQVRPGFGALTEARRRTLSDRGMAAKSDLRGRLAQRRVLGSSFAQDIQNRQEQELSKSLAEAEASSFLEELQATNQLINQRTNLSVQQAQSSLQNALAAFESERGAAGVDLDEQNRQLQVITNLIGGTTAQIGANARLEASMAAQSAAGRGAFAAGLGDSLGKIDFGSMFGGGGGGTDITSSFNPGSSFSGSLIQ